MLSLSEREGNRERDRETEMQIKTERQKEKRARIACSSPLTLCCWSETERDRNVDGGTERVRGPTLPSYLCLCPLIRGNLQGEGERERERKTTIETHRNNEHEREKASYRAVARVANACLFLSFIIP